MILGFSEIPVRDNSSVLTADVISDNASHSPVTSTVTEDILMAARNKLASSVAAYNTFRPLSADEYSTYDDDVDYKYDRQFRSYDNARNKPRSASFRSSYLYPHRLWELLLNIKCYDSAVRENISFYERQNANVPFGPRERGDLFHNLQPMLEQRFWKQSFKTRTKQSFHWDLATIRFLMHVTDTYLTFCDTGLKGVKSHLPVWKTGEGTVLWVLYLYDIVALEIVFLYIVCTNIVYTNDKFSRLTPIFLSARPELNPTTRKIIFCHVFVNLPHWVVWRDLSITLLFLTWNMKIIGLHRTN